VLAAHWLGVVVAMGQKSAWGQVRQAATALLPVEGL